MLEAACNSELICLSANRQGIYRAGPGFEFTENEVSTAGSNLTTPPLSRDVVEGLLVACGHTPIPAEYRTRTLTEVGVGVADQFGKHYFAVAKAILTRSSRVGKNVYRFKAPGLFERKDGPYLDRATGFEI